MSAEEQNRTHHPFKMSSNSSSNSQPSSVAGGSSTTPTPANNAGGGSGWGDKIWMEGNEQGAGHIDVRPETRVKCPLLHVYWQYHRSPPMPNQLWASFSVCRIKSRVLRINISSVRTWLVIILIPWLVQEIPLASMKTIPLWVRSPVALILCLGGTLSRNLLAGEFAVF